MCLDGRAAKQTMKMAMSTQPHQSVHSLKLLTLELHKYLTFIFNHLLGNSQDFHGLMHSNDLSMMYRCTRFTVNDVRSQW